MEKLLQALVDTGSEHAIIDITGVSAVDTQVAQHLLKTVMAARLLGAECIISGIRPQIAQTVVALGIEFGDITTKAIAGRRAAARAAPLAARTSSSARSAREGPLMERIPILRIGDILLVSIQVDLQDHIALALQEDLAERIVETGAHGVLIDISALEIVDSFIGRMISTIASVSAGPRRRDRRRRHAPGGRDHAGRAGPLPRTACAPRSTSTVASRCSRAPTSSTRRASDRRGRRRGPGRAMPVAVEAQETHADHVTTPTSCGCARPCGRSRSPRSCRWSTRPSWSPRPASWPATPWCTAAAGSAVGRARHRPARRRGVRAAFADQGPGIPDVDLALTDGWTSGTGLGLGLSGARRLVDEFELDTAVPAKARWCTIVKWTR